MYSENLSAAQSKDESKGFATAGMITKITRVRSHVKGNVNGYEAKRMKEQMWASPSVWKTIKQL